MSRYFSHRKVNGNSRTHRAWFEANNQPLIPSLEVADHDAINTGLIDHRGDPIMRAPNPVGFGRDEEW